MTIGPAFRVDGGSIRRSHELPRSGTRFPGEHGDEDFQGAYRGIRHRPPWLRSCPSGVGSPSNTGRRSSRGRTAAPDPARSSALVPFPALRRPQSRIIAFLRDERCFLRSRRPCIATCAPSDPIDFPDPIPPNARFDPLSLFHPPTFLLDLGISSCHTFARTCRAVVIEASPLPCRIVVVDLR